VTKQTHSTSPDTNPITVSNPQLRASLNGRVITPEDAIRNAARTVFSGGINRCPPLIVRAKDATDVSRVVLLARESGH
jgi:hypothetical protein